MLLPHKILPGVTRISHGLSTAAADPGMSTLHSVGLLDVLSSTPAEPSVARLVSMPVCAASLQNPVRNAGKVHFKEFKKLLPI